MSTQPEKETVERKNVELRRKTLVKKKDFIWVDL